MLCCVVLCCGEAAVGRMWRRSGCEGRGSVVGVGLPGGGREKTTVPVRVRVRLLSPLFVRGSAGPGRGGLLPDWRAAEGLHGTKV